MTKTSLSVSEQLDEIASSAQHALLARLEAEGLSYERETVLLDFQRLIVPQRAALQQQMAPLVNNPDTIDTETDWVEFWRRRVGHLADQAFAVATTRRAQAQADAGIAMNQWRVGLGRRVRAAQRVQ